MVGGAVVVSANSLVIADEMDVLDAVLVVNELELEDVELVAALVPPLQADNTNMSANSTEISKFEAVMCLIDRNPSLSSRF